MKRPITTFVFAAILPIAAAACAQSDGTAPAAAEKPAATAPAAKQPAAGAGTAAQGHAVVASVAGSEITRADLDKAVKAQLIELENTRFEILEQGLQQLVTEKLLEQEANARGISSVDLQRDEIYLKVGEPTEEEIQTVYDDNKAQLEGAPLESVTPQIVQYIKSQKVAEVARALFASLRAKYETKVFLEPPVVEVGTGGRPSRGGGADAPVTIVAFSDYECPYCKAGEGTIQQVLDTYGDKVRYVHRDFPLSFHANAHQASQAARCAEVQGKYWEYHEALFASGRLSLEKFGEIADELSLDRVKFDECLASGQFKAAVDADIEAASNVGVNGTPAFFINGRSLSGAQPFENLKAAIDAALEKAKS